MGMGFELPAAHPHQSKCEYPRALIHATSPFCILTQAWHKVEARLAWRKWVSIPLSNVSPPGEKSLEMGAYFRKIP